jgi:hypothetical protein
MGTEPSDESESMIEELTAKEVLTRICAALDAMSVAEVRLLVMEMEAKAGGPDLE